MKQMPQEIAYFVNRIIFGFLFIPGILWVVSEFYAHYTSGTGTVSVTDYYLQFYSRLDNPVTWFWILSPYLFFLLVRPHTRKKSGTPRTALHKAARRGRSDAIKTLIDEGTDVNAPDTRHQTPLHLAAMTDNVDVVRTLINAGADIDLADPGNGMRPLHNAASNGCVHVCEYLLRHGADMDAKTALGNTPLHLAAAQRYSDVVSLLLNYHAGYDIRNNAGLTAEEVAANKGYSGIVAQIQHHSLNEWRYPRMVTSHAS